MINIEIKKSKDEYRELGKVSWHRNYDFAIAESERTGKPVLLQFQEVPGCSTCVNFGREVLSHPLMVEIIEDKFIPLAIFNNHPGKDALVLKRFNEPSWNNPVTYFLDSSGNSIIPKLSNNYHPFSMYNKISEVLLLTDGALPSYFELLAGDLKTDYGYAEQTYFETPCFWSGETTMAQHPAVISTEAGWIGHKEVVEVYFDPTVTKLDELNRYAQNEGFFLIGSGSFRTDKAPQYYLRGTPYKYLPLSQAQRTQINRAIPYRESPESYLSPRQLFWLNDASFASRSDATMYEKNISEAWALVNKVDL